jgi:membrane-associated PAP2 superfamily phosphatase
MSAALHVVVIIVVIIMEGHAVAELVETIWYKPEGRRFEFRMKWNF